MKKLVIVLKMEVEEDEHESEFISDTLQEACEGLFGGVEEFKCIPTFSGGDDEDDLEEEDND